MQIAVLTEDEAMETALLQHTQPGTEWVFYNRPEFFLDAIGKKGFDKAIVESSLVDPGNLEEAAESAAETELFVVRTGSRPTDEQSASAAWKALCARTRGLSLSRWCLTAREAASEALRWLYGGSASREGGRLIAFIGTTPNIGTTLVSFGTAVRLALDSEISVGYLCLNLKSSKLHRYRGSDYASASLDGIRAELKARHLQPDRLFNLCEQVRRVPRLRMLYGNMLREQAEFFQPEEIDCLLEAAKAAFDLCIVEVNAYWDNAATVCAMLQAEAKVVVTTGELAHFQEDMQRWLKTAGPLFGLSTGSAELVVNQLDKRTLAGGIRSKDVRKETGLRLAAEIPRFPDIPHRLNEGGIMELFTGSHPFRAPVAQIADRWIRQWNLPRAEPEPERRWTKRLFFLRSEGRKVTGVESK